MPLLLLSALAAFLLDLGSKIWVRTNVLPGARRELWPGVVHLEYVTNPGAAWGVLNGQRVFLVIFSIVMVGAVLAWARQAIALGKFATVGLGLILGGAIGNLLDRILSGVVTDFIDVDTSIEVLRTFPVFNVADSALTVGVVLMLLGLLFNRKAADPAPPIS